MDAQKRAAHHGRSTSVVSHDAGAGSKARSPSASAEAGGAQPASRQPLPRPERRGGPTVHEVGQVDDAGRAAGVGVGQPACVAQAPAEDVGDDHDGAEGLDAGRRPRHVDRQPVQRLFGPLRLDIAAERALEAVLAEPAGQTSLGRHLGRFAARFRGCGRPSDEESGLVRRSWSQGWEHEEPARLAFLCRIAKARACVMPDG